MNKEKYLQFIASFVIIMLFNFLFYVPRVHGSISSVSIKGSDGISGFAKQTDTLDIEALVSIGNSTIKNDQIYLGSTISFDSCSGSGNQNTKCTVKFPQNGSQNLGNEPLQFVINLFKNSSQLELDDSKISTVVIDNQPPDVRISLPKNIFSGQENIVVNYESTDTACTDPSCAGFCVGIKDIEISTNGTFKKTIDPNVTGCSAISSLTIDSKNVKDGLNSISAKATDKFGQVSTQKTISFTVDAIPPNVVTNSLVILRRGINLNTFSHNSVPVEVRVILFVSWL